LSKEAGLFTNEMDLHLELAEVSHKLGDNENAYGYFLRYDELKDSLFVLVIFLIILMNQRLKLNDRILDLLIFIFFLIVFEASLVAYDPLIDQLSHGEVLIKVIFNSGLAFAIFTAHHFLEERMNMMIGKK
jgi:hypothetical protein